MTAEPEPTSIFTSTKRSPFLPSQSARSIAAARVTRPMADPRPVREPVARVAVTR